ncbi:hypothetical protein ABZ759_16095 [Streptomyces sp. NPDC047860]|uniref:hypothetical protein n=1 Tax=Streptomyces sp. NPDC047860 TaxID=3155743 RepID=UPI0033CC3D1B
MGRGGTSRVWVGAFGAPNAGALPACSTPAGCGAADSGHSGRAFPSAGAGGGSTGSPSPLCVVGRWSREVLDDRAYGDYQFMGLSGGEYDMLREMVHSARAAAKRQGAGDAREAARPNEGPWP